MKKSGKGENRPEMFVNFFKDGHVHTAAELMSTLGFSRSAVTRHLKKNNALTSVNGNGQYYVLPGTVKFNRNGLGSIEGKIFSESGNLLSAIVMLASDGSSGMSPGEMEKLLRTNVQSQCLILFREAKLYRKKHGRTFYYFSMDGKKREEQLAARFPATARRGIDHLLKEETPGSLRDTVKILVSCIRNPQFSPKSIALSLIRRGGNITTEKVKAVFEKYGLAKKNS